MAVNRLISSSKGRMLSMTLAGATVSRPSRAFSEARGADWHAVASISTSRRGPAHGLGDPYATLPVPPEGNTGSGRAGGGSLN